MTFFVVPVIGAGTVADKRRPKYIAALGVDWAACDHDDTFIVWANTTPAQEAAVGANPDALVVPPLDNAVAVAATRTALEALNVPSQWVTAGMTYRQVLRVVIGMAQLAQRCSGLGVPLKMAGNLDKTMAQLPANVRQALASAADDLQLDRTAIVATTTVREALKILGQQFLEGKGVTLGDL